MPQERLQVLLIEHDDNFARSLGEMLHQGELDADISSAPGLTAGLSALHKRPFDVVVLDVCVPDGAGLASVSLIKAEAPQLPVIVAGDANEEAVAVEAVHAGAQDYLVKGQLTSGWLERSIRYAIERHRLDLSLLAAEEKYHSVFDHLVEGIFRTTPDGHYMMANPALARIYGYESPEELVQTMTDISRSLYLLPDRRAEFIRLMQKEDTLSGFESQVYRKDGSIIWISENCRAVRDRQGRILYYEGTVEDITQRRQAEDNLRLSEALYHSLVETLPQNIFRKDLEDRFTFANQQFCRALGRRAEEIVGKTDFDFFPRELAEKYQRDDRQVCETGQPYETVEEHQPPGGGKLYVQVVKTPLKDHSGKVIGLQGIFWDITAQRLAEEEIRRTNALLAQSQKEIQARNTQMQDDLRMAREIQVTMLPQQQQPISFPASAIPAQSALQFTHRYLPAGTVGGDFFSISALSESEAGVFICDVAGHGVRSALVTAMIRGLAEELKSLATEPGQFLSKLNRDLHAILRHTGTPMLTTAFYLVMDSGTGQIRYANAGHPKPLRVLRHDNSVAPLLNGSGRSQPALGLFEEVAYETTLAQLTPRDLVLLYTDGLYEVEAPTGELYTQALLLDAAQRRVRHGGPALCDELITEVQTFAAGAGFTDDVCLVAVEFNPSADQ